ncbi:hypothetical protein L1887_20347 [Cichorium endivia]|nr:hypothetical protein L1887_20347 [Cichorium endivia]
MAETSSSFHKPPPTPPLMPPLVFDTPDPTKYRLIAQAVCDDDAPPLMRTKMNRRSLKTKMNICVKDKGASLNPTQPDSQELKTDAGDGKIRGGCGIE